jgi:hypothetical protein
LPRERKPDIDALWRKIVPEDSIRTKIIRRISEDGPSSAYDISKAVYGGTLRGYANILRNLGLLKSEKILRRTQVESQTGGKRVAYSLTEFIGIPACWAYIGPSLDFDRLLEVNRSTIKESEGLSAYRVMWQELGPEFCVKTARKSFIAIIQGLDDRSQIFNMLVGYMLDGTIRTEKIVAMAQKNPMFEIVIREAIDELERVAREIRKSPSYRK